MDLSEFRKRLAAASDACREFTSTLIFETVFDRYLYYVKLNCSHDGNATEHDKVLLFPDDTNVYGDCIGPLDAEAVASLLWRNHHVPEWIDISVWRLKEETTHFKLLCCGRFNENDDRLYYTWNSQDGQVLAPFGIKGPPIPKRIAFKRVWDEKYSLRESNEDYPDL